MSGQSGMTVYVGDLDLMIMELKEIKLNKKRGGHDLHIKLDDSYESMGCLSLTGHTNTRTTATLQATMEQLVHPRPGPHND